MTRSIVQSDSTRGDSGACDGLFPPASDSAGVDVSHQMP